MVGPCRDNGSPWMWVEEDVGELRLMGQGVLEALMWQQDLVFSLRRGSNMGHQQGQGAWLGSEGARKGRGA